MYEGTFKPDVTRKSGDTVAEAGAGESYFIIMLKTAGGLMTVSCFICQSSDF